MSRYERHLVAKFGGYYWDRPAGHRQLARLSRLFRSVAAVAAWLFTASETRAVRLIVPPVARMISPAWSRDVAAPMTTGPPALLASGART